MRLAGRPAFFYMQRRGDEFPPDVSCGKELIFYRNVR